MYEVRAGAAPLGRRRGVQVPHASPDAEPRREHPQDVRVRLKAPTERRVVEGRQHLTVVGRLERLDAELDGGLDAREGLRTGASYRQGECDRRNRCRPPPFLIVGDDRRSPSSAAMCRSAGHDAEGDTAGRSRA